MKGLPNKKLMVFKSEQLVQNLLIYPFHRNIAIKQLEYGLNEI